MCSRTQFYRWALYSVFFNSCPVFYEKFLSVCLQKMHISTINKWTSVVFFRMMTKRFEKELEWGANMNFNKQKMLSVFLSFMVHLGLVSSVTGGSKQAEQKKTQEIGRAHV